MEKNRNISVAVLSALAAAFIPASVQEKIAIGALTVVCFFIFDILFRSSRQYLVPAFQILFSFVVLATFFEAFALGFLGNRLLPFPAAIVSSFLMSQQVRGNQDRAEIGLLFLIFLSLLVGIQQSAVFAWAVLTRGGGLWCAQLLVLAVIQIWFYRISSRRFFRLFIFYWAGLYFGLLAAEIIRRYFSEIGMEWWQTVAASVIGFSIGETALLLSRANAVLAEKRQQIFPSFFSVSVLFVMLVWLSQEPPVSSSEAHTLALQICSGSMFITLFLIGIWEKLALYDLPGRIRGFPMLLITAFLFWMGLAGWFR